MGLENDQVVTSKPLQNTQGDLPGIWKDFLYTPGDRNMQKKIISLQFNWIIYDHGHCDMIPFLISDWWRNKISV